MKIFLKIGGDFMKYEKKFCGEIYTLIRAVVEQKIKSDYEFVKKNYKVWLPMLKFFKNEMKNNFVHYKMCNKNFVELYFNDRFICKMKTGELADISKKFYGAVIDENRFDAKSKFKNPPTLFNCSQETNFKFKIPNISDEEILRINSIDTKSKIKDRVSKIGNLEFVSLGRRGIFANNLLFIDTRMTEILAEMVKIYYSGNIRSCVDIVNKIEEENPLNFPIKNLYKHKLKKFLCSVALGMQPTKIWNGLDEANGGYIVVKDNGEILAYHLYDRDSFENYLLENTKFETGDADRHKFGTIYTEDERQFINLNLQVRFR